MTAVESPAIGQPSDVYIVGLGMVAHRQFTFEVDAALQRCRTIFLLHGDSLVRDHVAARYRAEVSDLGELYRPGRDRAAIYREMTNRVLAAAETAAPVAFASYGHPLVYVAASRQIWDEAIARGLTVRVMPGISALDALLIDLKLDPAVEGLQMYEATDLLLRERPLQLDVPLLIWQIGALERLTYDEDQTERQFVRFTQYLLRFYPPTHHAIVARTATLPIAKPRRVETELERLPSLFPLIGSADTLYVPPVSHRPVRDRELLQELKGRTHESDPKRAVGAAMGSSVGVATR